MRNMTTIQDEQDNSFSRSAINVHASDAKTQSAGSLGETADTICATPMDDSKEQSSAPSCDATFRKIDYRILPVLALMYLLCLLDRTNLGNARIAGLQHDLKMTNYQYSVALSVTYVPYLFTDFFSNLVLRAVGAHIMLPAMVTLWGVVATLQGVVRTYQGLLACRFFLGLAEGGLLPGLALYLAAFYPRHILQVRLAAVCVTSALSGAFSGLLAAAILQLNGQGGLARWSWIFIIEGAFTVVFGAFTFFLLPRSPAHAHFLQAEEKSYVLRILQEDGAISSDEKQDKISLRQVLTTFTAPQVWLMAPVFFFHGTILYSLAYFTPSIVQGLGYEGIRAQLFTVPPFLCAFVVTLILSYVSDRFKARIAVTMICSLLSVIGMSMFLTSHRNKIQYASLFFSISGLYSMVPCVLTIFANNVAPHARRATALAIGFALVNFGGILSTWLLGYLSPGPRYTSAVIVLLSFSVGIFLFSGATGVYMFTQNKRKAEIRACNNQVEEQSGLGDRSAWFIYSL